MNIVRTGMLMAVMTGLFLFVGGLVGGETGMVIAFVMAAGLNFLAYWKSDSALLHMYGAREVDETSAPALVHTVQQLSAKARLPMPKVFISDNPQPNAFATGRNPEHAAICVTSGLLSRVNDEELAGVLAHELSHVKNRDTLTMTITATMAGAISMLANFAFYFGGGRRNPLGIIGMLLVTLFAPIAAMLVQMAVSRTREFEADRSRARNCRGGRYGLRRPCKTSRPRHRPSTTRRRICIPRPRICSSSIRCMARSPECSRAIPPRRNAWRGLRRWQRKWAKRPNAVPGRDGKGFKRGIACAHRRTGDSFPSVAQASSARCGAG